MREYLAYSLGQVQKVLLLKDWKALRPEQHETMAAFRVRFCEFQEHLGKTMRAVAIEEEQDVERFGAVLTFMERLQTTTMSEVTRGLIVRVGVDLAKRVIQVHAVDTNRRRLACPCRAATTTASPR